MDVSQPRAADPLPPWEEPTWEWSQTVGRKQEPREEEKDII